MSPLRPQPFRPAASRYWLAFVLIASLSASGCAVNPPPRHVLAFDRNGEPIDPTGNVSCRTRPADDPMCHGRLNSFLPPRRLQDDLQPVFDWQRRQILEGMAAHPKGKDGKRRVLLFIHGGLNSRRDALDRVEDLHDDLLAAGYYPLFINWRSSLRSSYLQHLLFLRQGKDLGWKVAWSSPFVLTGDLLRGAARAPIAWSNEIKNAWWSRRNAQINTFVRQTAEELETRYEETGEPPALWEGEDCRKTGEQLASGAAFVATIPTKALTAPLLDSLGTKSWDVMLRRTEVLFHYDEDFRNATMIPSTGAPPEPTGRLALFFRELDDLIRRTGGRDEWEITLVGHSMGTIVMNRLLESFQELPADRLVYMAAACSLRDYQETVVPYLRHNPNARMYHLVLHEQAEVRERWDKLGFGFFDWPSRGSLLVWIDDLFGSGRTTFDRTAGRFTNLMRIVRLTEPEVLKRVSIKAYGTGRCVADTDPQKHGDFGSRLKWWVPECWEPSAQNTPACIR
jgi:pimeloyl-ACP methyl ester carboxylesterase